ncbi:MAG: hypothetical protein WBG86_13555 [Polyangiales bacterium]
MSNTMPSFTAKGILPQGDYGLTLDELRGSLLCSSSTGVSQTWDSQWRRQLVDNLALLAKQLWSIGLDRIFVDGSFVEDKDHPNDIDGYFECELSDFASGRVTRELNLLDPHKCWTWDPDERLPYRGYPKRQLPMWHRYRVELYPHYGQFSGILDDHGHELEFPSAFRRSRRDGTPRGIIKLIQGGGV